MRQVTLEDVEALKKSGLFDAAWYLETYKDVEMLGMDPAEHFLKYGFQMDRDPDAAVSTAFYKNIYASKKITSSALLTLQGASKSNADTPALNEKTILLAAHKEACIGKHDRAVALAIRYLPENICHTVNILRANRAIAYGREDDWLASVNTYLAHYDAKPISLKPTAEPLLNRFYCDPLASVTGGELVSVIMPAWNSEKTLGAAVASILNQTWKNLELLIVDDASTDGTWSALQDLAATDSRVRILRNKVNVGPYVSKNIALMQAKGQWITGHDADDWAHPQRLENHLAAVKVSGEVDASLTYMIRMQGNGTFDSIGRTSDFSPDGVTRVSSISALYRHSTLQNQLGYWDSVRFAADSEMISRSRAILGARFKTFQQMSMICLSEPTGLTNHPEHGIAAGGGGLSVCRSAFKSAWVDWHKTLSDSNNTKMPFPHTEIRPYEVPEIMAVPHEHVERNIKSSQEAPITLPALVGKNGGRFRIAARGDCTSRRLVHLNPDLFPAGVEFVQSQKSPAVLFVDSLNGTSATESDLNAISDVPSMPKTLQSFYLGQADRKILSLQDVDLILIDSYADMNFELWQHKAAGWKVWIHPKHLSNPDQFYETFEKLGRRTLEESIKDIKALVGALRKNSPNAPVLFLNQQTDYYPKLDHRLEYYDLGKCLVAEVSNSYFGGVVPREELALDDIGSCGPGLTLHFQPETYREMIITAFRQGLFSSLSGVEPSEKAVSHEKGPTQAPEPELDTLDVALPENLIARDNPEKVEYPIRHVNFGLGQDSCQTRCPTASQVEKSFGRYICLQGKNTPLTWTPVGIALDEIDDYAT